MAVKLDRPAVLSPNAVFLPRFLAGSVIVVNEAS
jgi:hypothetical protein